MGRLAGKIERLVQEHPSGPLDGFSLVMLCLISQTPGRPPTANANTQAPWPGGRFQANLRAYERCFLSCMMRGGQGRTAN